MKAFKILITFIVLTAFSSCVTSKKFNSLNSAYKKSQDADKNCEEALRSAQEAKDQLKSLVSN